MIAPSLEWLGCATTLLGSALLASRTRASAFGWIAYLISNCLWIGYGLLMNINGIVVMQATLTATSLLGLYRHRRALAAVSTREAGAGQPMGEDEIAGGARSPRADRDHRGAAQTKIARLQALGRER
jgi:hypothetical protein